MRRRNVQLIGLLAALGMVAVLGSALAADGDGDAVAVTADDQALMDRLVALHDDLPDLLPTEASLAANALDPVLLGSFTSARSTLDQLEDDIRQLFIDGDEVGTAAGDAVAGVARGLLIERQAYLVLEQSDGSTNPRPLDSSNARTEDGLAIDADGLLGLESVGIDLLIEARDLQRAGYEVLEDTEGADPSFAARLAELQAYQDEVEVTLRVAASMATDELLVPADRYDAPIGVPRAVSVTYVCVDREQYLGLVDLSQTERVAASVTDPPSAECAELARRAGLSLEDQQAAVETEDTQDADDGDEES